jgi:hypothetical protein
MKYGRCLSSDLGHTRACVLLRHRLPSGEQVRKEFRQHIMASALAGYLPAIRTIGCQYATHWT